MNEKQEFVIYGKVKGKESKDPLDGLIVEALDKDLLVDDRLGSAVTDEEGAFVITYDQDDFQEVFFDQKPDIYLRVKNPEGEVIYTTIHKVKYEANKVEKFDLALSEELLKPKVESERQQFKQLTAVNPNYFGNVTDEAIKAEYQAVSDISHNTKYEELSCVGLYPEDNLLEAVIEVKLPYGFRGSLCSEGSKEYVAFYIDYGDGSGFVSVGAAAEVNVHNLSFVNGGHLYYAVQKGFVPKAYLACDDPQIVKVRAILSWEELPTGPNFPPVWGNVVDIWVQIKPEESDYVVVHQAHPFEQVPIGKFNNIKLPSEAKAEPPTASMPASDKVMIFGEKAEIRKLIDRTSKAESRIREEGKVEEERFDFTNLTLQNPNYFGSICESQEYDEILNAVYNLPAKTVESMLSKFVLNPDWLMPGKLMFYNTTYEELRCVGLYPEDDLLEAVIEVKLPYGFSGGLCTLGSVEYVAFYIDYDDGLGYQYVATSTVATHDIPDAGDKPLYYAVKATIPDIDSKLKTCTIENIVKVKAILSWNLDPTPYGHMYTPPWGNVLVRNIQLRPNDGPSVTCDIKTVNQVHTGDISQSGGDEGLAVKIDASDHAVPGVFDRPFGGKIGCWGTVNIPGAVFYRFRYSIDGGASWVDITDSRIARHPVPFILTRTRTPDSDGWFSVSDYIVDKANYSLTALVHWNSAGKDGEYLLKLELARADKTVFCEDEVFLKLDNKNVELFEFGGTPAPLPAEGIVVKDSGGNYKKCGTFVADEEIKIYGNFRDDYFRGYSLRVFGGNIDVSGFPIGSGRYDSAIPGISSTGVIGAHDGGLGVELETLDLCTVPQPAGKVKCAYGIRLAVSDRAIVGRVRGYEFDTYSHGKHAYVTFDWDPTGC